MLKFGAPVLLGVIPLSCLAAAPQAHTPEERAREIVNWLLADRYEEVFRAFTPQMRQGLPLEILKNKAGPSLKTFGSLRQMEAARVNRDGIYEVAVVPLTFERAAIEVRIAFNSAGQVAGLYFRPGQGQPIPSWQRPAYSKPETFSEREIVIGDDPWKLPGTLTLPKAKPPFAGLVLVHGSGPNDRDETVLGNKVFKDLAEGLASRGIAVLRYEKRTRAYALQMSQDKNLTVQEETVADAVKAAALLRGLPEIDPRRVFVLGHSLGGYLLPLILKQDPKAAGGIIMAGSTRPLEDLVLDQVEYVASLQDAQNPEVRKRVEDVREAVAAMKKLKPGDKEPPPLMGMPAHYLLALRGYNPPAEAAALHRPLLILQGERDYQVTMKDFGNWKSAMEGRFGTTLKAYPSLNHLFVPGQGKSMPSEYQKPGHVSPDVIEDIAKWLATQPAGV